jgi:hypothetical protein
MDTAVYSSPYGMPIQVLHRSVLHDDLCGKEGMSRPMFMCPCHASRVDSWLLDDSRSGMQTKAGFYFPTVQPYPPTSSSPTPYSTDATARSEPIYTYTHPTIDHLTLHPHHLEGKRKLSIYHIGVGHIFTRLSRPARLVIQ